MTWRKGKATCILCMLLVVGFYLRSESLWQTVVVLPAIRADAGDYFMYAYNLYHHGIYSRDHRGLSEATKISSILPDAVRSPGYPLFLTLFMGDQPISGILAHVLLIQVLISTLTVALAYLMYRRFLNLPWAASAALLTALSPHLIVVNIYLLTETLFCFFLVAAAGVGKLDVIAGVLEDRRGSGRPAGGRIPDTAQPSVFFTAAGIVHLHGSS